jgi:hypothetical protein
VRRAGEDDDVEEALVGEDAVQAEGLARCEARELDVRTALAGADVGDIGGGAAVQQTRRSCTRVIIQLRRIPR